eukprot:TRINITY_DN5365_c4_g1_i1.p1 TRINITY_DN5365_c4_g1~~TRINITY_DN5365_c4_g1_i1.p1  ORF type:complete len:795 (+),score=148.60 TRINITY_DN5365_c4_g1_i1:28-2385(+)
MQSMILLFLALAAGEGEPCEGNTTSCTDSLENFDRATKAYMVGGLVSIVGSLAMLVSYFKASLKQKLPPADLLRNKTLCDMGNSVAFVVPVFVKNHYLTDMCKVQAVIIQFFSTASLVWWVCFSVELLWSVQNPFTNHASHLGYYHLSVWVSSLISTAVLLNSDDIGLTEFDFCWVEGSTTHLSLSFTIFYGPVMLGYLFSLTVLIWVSSIAKVAIPASHKIRTVAISQGQWYIGLIGAFWTFTGMVWFGGFGAGNKDSFPLIILMAVSIASRGLVALAVWLKTSQLALKGYTASPVLLPPVSRSSNARMNSLRSPLKTPILPHESIQSHPDDESRTEVPDATECRESVPLKWALRRDVMIACQQGISTMTEMLMEELRSVPCKVVSDADFTQEVIRQVDREDSDSVRFTFYDYAPKVFHSIRIGTGMTPDTYHSIFSFTDIDDRMMEKFSDGGSSGSFFYFTPGKEFIVKTVTQAEAKLLKSFLPDYYDHLSQNTDTLIVRFYGLYAIKMHRGARVTHFVVMDNVFLTKRHVDEVYDLKGSWVDRGPVKKREPSEGDLSPGSISKSRAFFSMLGYGKAGKQQSRVMKDMDISGVKQLVLDGDVGATLLRQIEEDTKFFIRHNIMDYSLLLGIHRGPFSDLRVPKDDLAVDLCAPHDSTQSPLSSRKHRQNTYAPPSSSDFSDFSTPKPRPAIHRRNEGGLYSACTTESQHNGDSMYFMGIIDILQTWTLQKKVERLFKTVFLKKDPVGMSAIEPYRYGKRFITRCSELFLNPDVHGAESAISID